MFFLFLFLLSSLRRWRKEKIDAISARVEANKAEVEKSRAAFCCSSILETLSNNKCASQTSHTVKQRASEFLVFRSHVNSVHL